MLRNMRRKKQELSFEDCKDVLRRGSSGVLAVLGDNEYPYAVPLSYVYHENSLYFHCAEAGHKLDAIARDNRVSFCVIDKDEVIPQEFTTYFRSVIAFGKARIVDGEAEKRNALLLLLAKYSSGHEQKGMVEIDKFFQRVCVIALDVEHVTGKEAIELVADKNQPFTNQPA